MPMSERWSIWNSDILVSQTMNLTCCCISHHCFPFCITAVCWNFSVVACFMIWVMDFSFCPFFPFSVSFFSVLFVFVEPLPPTPPTPHPSISVQAAKLQWSLDEKVGSSRGTRVSRQFVYMRVWCWCVVLLIGLTWSVSQLVYGKPLCILLCCVLTLFLKKPNKNKTFLRVSQIRNVLRDLWLC